MISLGAVAAATADIVQVWDLADAQNPWLWVALAGGVVVFLLSIERVRRWLSRTPELHFIPKTRRIEAAPDDLKWRIRVDVLSVGHMAPIDAWVVEPVPGIQQQDYGWFALKWELSSEMAQLIPPDDVRRLEVARVAIDGSKFRFMGPEQAEYKGGTAYKVLDFDEISFTVRFHDLRYGNHQDQRFTMGWDKGNEMPFLRLD